MKKYIQKIKHSELLFIGFTLFFLGILLVTVLDGSRFFELLGLALLVIAGAAFGASINAEDSPKNKSS